MNALSPTNNLGPKSADMILNDDCWHMILLILKTDFKTLSRMMQVSRYFLAMTTPMLYSQLGVESNKERVESWSNKKQVRLASLLITSCGCLGSFPVSKMDSTGRSDADRNNNNNNDDDEGNVDSFEKLYTNPAGLQFRLKLPWYAPPLSMDYFGYLTRLPSWLIREELWKRLLEGTFEDSKQDEGDDDGDDENVMETDQVVEQSLTPTPPTAPTTTITTQRLATVLSEIVIHTLNDIEKWLPEVERFEKLEKFVVAIWGDFPRELKLGLYEFVNRHRIQFPGLLKQVVGEGYDNGHISNLLSIVLTRPSQLELWLYDGVYEQFFGPDDNDDDDGGKCSENDNSNENGTRNTIASNAMIMLRSLKELKFSEVRNHKFMKGRDPKTLKILIQIFQQCRELEKLEIWAGFHFHVLWARLLVWASQELRKVEAAELSSWSSTTTTLNPSTKTRSSLIPLKSFSGSGLPGSVLMNAMDGFRYTLEEIDFGRVISPKVISFDWHWIMNRLRVLKLSDCSLQFCKLEMYCPVLEELYLESVDSAEDYISEWDHPDILQHRIVNNTQNVDHHLEIELIKRPWKALPLLTVLRCLTMRNSTRLDLNSIEKLSRLKELCLGRKEELNADDENFFGRKEPVRLLEWDLKDLKRFTVSQVYYLDWEGLILRSAPNLEYLCAPLVSMVPLSTIGFWEETRWQSLEAVGKYENRVNKNFPDQEQLRQQLETRLEKEKELWEKYKTLEGKDIWNAHVTKIRTLEINGSWSNAHVERLKNMFKSHHHQTILTNGDYHGSRVSTDNNIINSVINTNITTALTATATNTSSLNDKVCFPDLCHLLLKPSHVDEDYQDVLDDLIHEMMQRPNMTRIEAPKSVLSKKFLETLKMVPLNGIPCKWESEYGELDNVENQGYCVLVVCDHPYAKMYYRL